MKKYLLKLTALCLVAVTSVCCLLACSKGENSASADKSGNNDWFDWTEWEDWGDGDADYSYGYEQVVVIPSFNYNGETLWIGAEGTYYDGGNYEAYTEEGTEGFRPIITNLEGVTVSFKVVSNVDAYVRFQVRTAVNIGRKYEWRWASDKFRLTVNEQNVDLSGEENNVKWIWQQGDNWWFNDNYIDADFGNIHLVQGENTISLKVGTYVEGLPTGEVQLDCFIIGG